MAGDWLKWAKGLAKKPEVLHMAAALGKSRHEVAGLLMEFWEWADENAELEDASVVCPGVVRSLSASATLVDGLTAASGFADAMASVGWLSIRPGRIEFPKFARHNGKHAKGRALDAERKRATRLAASASASGSHPDRKRTREEKRREEKKEEETPLPPCPPPPLNTEEFAAAWKRYEDHRRAIRAKKLQPHSVAARWGEMASWGHAGAIASIEQTIANGYTGLFPPKNGRAGGKEPDFFEKLRESAHTGGSR